jgi:hypothetical protein
MSQIQNLGNGIGWIYAALPNGSNTIVCVEKNTIQGVHNMRQIGTTTAPIVANRSAVGTIQITAVPSAGDIASVTINGVNQIGANVPVTVGQVNQTATDLAAAINAFTPTGYSFTAEAIADIVYVYSAPEDGALVNGLTITISVTNIGITTTTTPFSGGSNQDGVYDSNFGYQFYLDSSSFATPSTINLSTAEDVSEYFVTRGLQTGIFTQSLSVNSSAQLLNITRCSAFTNILTDTNSMNPTSDLTFINTSGFVQGDVVRLTQFDSSRVVTVVDVSNAQQFPANIYLTNADPFNCQDNKSIELRLQYDSVLGAIWIENSRSFVAGPNIVTRGEMIILVNNNQVKIGENYLVTNAGFPNYPGIDGVIITGISTNAVSTSGQALFYLPDYDNISGTNKCSGTWNELLSSVTAAQYYAWNGSMYESLTGVVGLDPSTDSINWALVPITDPTYVKEVHTVQYNLSSNDIVKREDKRGNSVTGTATIGFRFGDNDVTNNIVQGGLLDSNIVGQFNNNFIVNSTINGFGILNLNFNSNVIYGTLFSFSNLRNPIGTISIENNNFTNAQFTINNSNVNISYPTPTTFSGNYIQNGRFKLTISANSAPQNLFVENNTYIGAFNNAGSQFNLTSIGTGVPTTYVTNNFITSSRTISLTFQGLSSLIIFNYFTQNTISNVWANSVSFVLTEATILGCTFTNISNTTITNYFVTSKIITNEFITSGYSSYILDVFAINAISGTTLTLPNEVLAAGTVKLYGAGTYTIDKILVLGGEYPRQPIKIICDTGVIVTITPTLASSAVTGSILSDGGTVIINDITLSPSLILSDFYVVQANLKSDSAGTIAQPYWIKQYNTEIQ